MEKPPPAPPAPAAAAAKPKKKLMKILTRAVSSITFQNHPSTPGRNKKAVAKADKHKLSHPNTQVMSDHQNLSIAARTPEPTSPKISCMGHIRHRKKWPKNMKLLLRKELNGSGNKITKPAVLLLPETTEKTTISSRMQNIERKSEVSSANNKSTLLIDRSASLSQMKRFGSSRDSLSKFDWKTEQRDQRDEEDKDEEEEVSFSFFPAIHQHHHDHDHDHVVGVKSGPIALKPRKESNLWKRRTNITQLKPIKVNSSSSIFRL